MDVPTIATVIAWLNQYLDPTRRDDYGPNGLQVDASPEDGSLETISCHRIATGVTSNLAFLQQAAAARADLVVVHHGLYWGGTPSTTTGSLGRRIAFCIRHGISVAGYHLPLDAHLEIGNAAGLAQELGLSNIVPAFPFKGQPTGVCGLFDPPIQVDEYRERLLRISDRAVLFEGGPRDVRSVGIVTGGAPRTASEASNMRLDAYISGEVSEYSQAIASEERIHVAGCGHHRSEVFGPQLLAQKLREVFPAVDTSFIDIDNLA